MKEKNKEYALDILKEVSEVVSHVDESKLEQLTDLILEIKKAGKKVYCAGAGRSLLMIRTFSMRLMHLGLRSYVVGETATPALEAGDLLIFGSGSGETGSLCAIQEKAEKAGARIATITRNPGSSLARCSELAVHIPLEYAENSIQPAGSVFEQAMLILCDAMVLRLLEKGNMLEGRDINDFIKILHTNLE